MRPPKAVHQVEETTMFDTSRDKEFLGRFQALTEMLIEASELVLKESEASDGLYGRLSGSRASYAKRNLEQLCLQANQTLTEFDNRGK